MVSSTLPRSHSVRENDSSFPSPNLFAKKVKLRPASLCEASWGRQVLLDPTNQRRDEVPAPLHRSPSMANHLSTTVPCSLVNKNLSGRHHPTRTSLRHSRMVVLRAHRDRGYERLRGWGLPGRILGAIGLAQGLLAIIMGGLAIGGYMWAPLSLPHTELPHYPAVPLLMSGCMIVGLLLCCSKTAPMGHQTYLKVAVVVCCAVAIVTSLCVCIFTALHLVLLAPMQCRESRHLAAVAPIEITTMTPSPPKSLNIVGNNAFSGSHYRDRNSNYYRKRNRVSRDTENYGRYDYGYDNSDSGSGVYFMEFPNDMGTDYYSSPYDESLTTTIPPAYVEEVSCVCEDWSGYWKRIQKYPDLSCTEVNKFLPVLSVAICTATAAAAILSGIVIYLIWAARHVMGGAVGGPNLVPLPPEGKPFIKPANPVRRSNSLQTRHSSHGRYYRNSLSPPKNCHSNVQMTPCYN